MIRAFLRLPAGDRRLLVRAYLALAAARVRLKMGAARALRQENSRKASGEKRGDPKRIAWAIEVASRRLPGTVCLPQALAAHKMLRKAGYAPEIKIGARKGEEFEAHAWVELEG